MKLTGPLYLEPLHFINKKGNQWPKRSVSLLPLVLERDTTSRCAVGAHLVLGIECGPLCMPGKLSSVK